MTKTISDDNIRQSLILIIKNTGMIEYISNANEFLVKIENDPKKIEPDQEAMTHNQPQPVLIDVKALREPVGMTPTGNALGIELNTLRYWEHGLSKPKGPALALLKVIAEKPDFVMGILSQSKMTDNKSLLV
jgi:DNA-binding transcriptional regulator YiaG